MFGFDERTISILESIGCPSVYWTNKTIEYKYWFRSLFQKMNSGLIFENLPENWDKDFLKLCLYVRGFVAVFPTARADLQMYGPKVVFNPCNVSGINFYYHPTNAQIANPYYEADLLIGKQCEIMKLTPDYNTTLDIVDHYAARLAEASKGLIMGLIQAKTAHIEIAKNEAQSATLKKVYDKIQAGETLVIFDDIQDNNEIIPTKEPFESWLNDFTKTYCVDKLQLAIEQLLNDFYVEIGLPVAIEKRERLISAEVDTTNAQSQARIATWYETISEDIKRINKRYSLNIGVQYALPNDNSGDRTGIEQE